MGQAVTFLSREEALLLPQSERPLNMRITNTMYHSIFQTVGAASLCWQPTPSNEVFDTEQATKVAIKLCDVIAKELERLGITTEQIEK